MAKIILGGNIGAISGSVGADTYSRNHYGYYIRKWSEPTGVASRSQLFERAQFAEIAHQWKELTNSQRLSWENMTYSINSKDVFGQNIRLTGQILFIKLNLNLLSVGLPIMLDPMPCMGFQSAIIINSVSISLSAGSGLLSFSPSPTDSKVIYKIFATESVSPGISKPYNKYRHIGNIAANSNSPYDFTADYLSVFPVPAADLKVFIKLVPICTETGLKGVDIINNTIVTI